MSNIMCRVLRQTKASLLRNACRTVDKRGLMLISDNEFTLEYLEDERQGIAVCSFNRPESRNAINKNLALQFQSALDTIRYENKLRVVILRSAIPGMFCAGADLKERAKMPQSQVGPFVGSLQRLSSDLAELPIPTIAAIDGAALGGGLELALCCDMRVASFNAKLGLVEARLAIIPGAGGTQRLLRLVGPARAKELIFTARMIDGQQAEELGVVNEAVYQNDAGDAAYLAALEMAEAIVPNGPIALRMAKLAIDKGAEVDLNSGLAFERAYYAQVIPTKDRMEGLKAFREKRKPVYKGE